MYKPADWIAGYVSEHGRYCASCKLKCDSRCYQVADRKIIGCFERGYFYDNGWMYTSELGVVKPLPAGKRYVLDSSAVLSGQNFIGEFEYYVTPSVLNEVSGRMRHKLELLPALKFAIPSPIALADVEKCAGSLGESGRLSDTDIEVLALARELQAVVLTDDYSMQNLAQVLGIEYQTLAQDGITVVRQYRYRCKGCGRYYEALRDECPVCGAELKSVRRASE